MTSEIQDNKPTRLLFVCHDASIYGSQRSLFLIVQNLPAEKYQCFVSIARPGALQEQLEALPNVTVLRHKRLQWVKHDQRNIVERAGDVFSIALSALSRTLTLYGHIRKHRIDIVHTNSTVSLEGALAAALANVPHVWHIRELFMERSPKFHLILGRWLSRRIIIGYSDVVVSISKAVQNQFGKSVNTLKSRFSLIYNALDENDFKAVPDSPEKAATLRKYCEKALELPDRKNGQLFRLGYIGRLSSGKGLHELIEAMRLLRERGMQIDLVVAGDFVDSAYFERITGLLQKYELGSSVRFLGYRDDLSTIYPVLDAVVVPSVNEPFGRVIIESMRYNIPCVASSGGGVPEIITSGLDGLLYPPGHPEKLADAIERLIQDPQLAETLIENAGRMVGERFTIETQINQLDLCYQSLLRHQLLK